MSSGPEEIALAIRRLREGGLVAFPTETVYGLGANAYSEPAVARVFAIKGRPARNPLIVHVSSIEMAKKCVSSWPKAADKLAKEFWPGPLSIVLPRNEKIPSNVSAGGPNVAVRCPDHSLALALLEAFGSPLVGPSANISGGVSPTTAEHVREAFKPEDVFVLDGGPCIGGIESTVISLAEREPAELRTGLITPDQIERVIGTSVRPMLPRGGSGSGGDTSWAFSSSVDPLPSPGLLDRHYAPHAPTRWFTQDQRAAVAVSLAKATDRPRIVLAVAPFSITEPHRLIAIPADPRALATKLYSAMREADAASPSEILIELPKDDPGIARAVRDRIIRAGDPWRAL